MGQLIRIALIQLALSGNMEQNLSKALRWMQVAATNGARLVCFPEIHLSPFFPQYSGLNASSYAIPIDHEVMTQFREQCRALNVVACPNIYLQEDDKRYDASPVIDADGSLLGVSKMVHIVQAPFFYEQDYYAPSDSGFQVYNTAVGRIGIVICFDRHFPESLRSCALKGAQLVVVPTANTVGEPLEMFAWELRVQAMQNGVYIAMCNRVGLEGEMDFCGESIVVDPNGDVVAKADDQEQILYADIDLGSVDQARQARPYLALRRPEAYER